MTDLPWLCTQLQEEDSSDDVGHPKLKSKRKKRCLLNCLQQLEAIQWSERGSSCDSQSIYHHNLSPSFVEINLTRLPRL